MWLLISVLKLTVVSVLSVPYGYNNYNTHEQVYHPVNFEAREILPFWNNGVKVAHTLSTVTKENGLMQHLTPPPISNPPNYYSFAPVKTQLPVTTQPPRQYYINPTIDRQHYMMTPRENYLPSVVTSTPITEIDTVEPTEKSHNDLEYQNTHNLEKAYESDDDSDDSQKYYSGGRSQKQPASHGNDPRDPKIQKPDVKLPERKDRIDFQVYGFDGPKSYKFGYDTGKGENRQFRYETRDRDGNVSGRYGYVDLTGKLNVVKYTSNADDGFRTETL